MHYMLNQQSGKHHTSFSVCLCLIEETQSNVVWVETSPETGRWSCVNREVELGPRTLSEIDCLLVQVSTARCQDSVFVTVPHSCWKSKLRSTQATFHWRGPLLLNIYCSGSGGRSFSYSQKPHILPPPPPPPHTHTPTPSSPPSCGLCGR